MNVETFEIEGPLVLTPRRFSDPRGYFSEIWRLDRLEDVIPGVKFVQDNHSFSSRAGTLRGMHCQLPPFVQGKLVRVPRGAVIDVIVDIRKGSKTYGRHLSVELSEDNWRQLWVPPGFLHGFCTLQDNTDFLYKVDAYYSPEHDRSVAWNDPDLGISWPFAEEQLLISDKDRAAGRLRDLPNVF